MKKIGIIILAVIVIITLLITLSYNMLVKSQEAVNEAWAQVQNVYQRRLDLVPNLVETVKGYAAHEKSTFMAVTEARSKVVDLSKGLSSEILNDPAKFKELQDAQTTLGSALARLLVVVENYPELRASENFLSLQSQLEGTENRIAVERRRFNETARVYNIKIRQFPTNIIANLFGFKSKAYFEAIKGAEEAPQVRF